MKRGILLTALAMLLLVGCGNNANSNMGTETEKGTEHTHNYAETITTEAACETEGLKTFTCECGDTYTEAIATKGHVYENYVSNNDATYLADGTETGTCVCGLTDTRTAEGSKLQYTYTDLDKVMYAKQEVNVRDLPSTDGNTLGGLTWAQEVHVTGQCTETSWYRIEYNGGVGYVSNEYLVDTKPVASTNNNTADNNTNNNNTAGNNNTNNSQSADPEKDPADANGDGVVTDAELNAYWSSFDVGEKELAPVRQYQQMVIDSGYFNVVKIDDTTYAMLSDETRTTPDGTRALIALREYLWRHNLDSIHLFGEWIDKEKGLYWYVAKYCYHIDEPPYPLD